MWTSSYQNCDNFCIGTVFNNKHLILLSSKAEFFNESCSA
jgi:hypothetical protein